MLELYWNTPEVGRYSRDLGGNRRASELKLKEVRMKRIYLASGTDSGKLITSILTQWRRL
jgi:hypothetical protein